MTLGFWSENGRNLVFLREILFFLHTVHIFHTYNAEFGVLAPFESPEEIGSGESCIYPCGG